MRRFLLRHAVALSTLGCIALQGGVASAVTVEIQGTELSETVSELALELGQPIGAVPSSRLAALPDSVSETLAQLLGAILKCHRGSKQILSGKSSGDLTGLLAGDSRLSAESSSSIARCADDLDNAAASAQARFRSLTADQLATARRVDLWPVLLFEPQNLSNSHLHDYSLIVDLQGNDLYANNAGGNLLDIVHGPVGSGSQTPGPAEGCQNIPALVRGKCTVSASLLLDMGGDDVYGVLQSPDEDAEFIGFDGKKQSCTTEPVVRRIATVGAGIAGAGMLVDDQGSDTYLGKTIAIGSGHVSGVGIVRDYGDDPDRYSAIRSAQGFGLVDGFGLLWDEGGSDSYDLYMPAGGVISDRGVCDAIPRNVQGAGLVAGIGILQDDSGSDRYLGTAQSLAYGGSGGAGIFWDSSGWDTYLGSERSNGTTIAPTAESVALFVDEGDEAEGAKGPKSCQESQPGSPKEGSKAAQKSCPAWGGSNRS